MTQFTDDNTEGYTQDQLDAMNNEFEGRAIEAGLEDIEDDQKRGDLEKHISADVCRWADRSAGSR